MRSIIRTAMVLGLMLLSVVVAAPAQAHAKLIGTEPAAGQNLAVAPSRITLNFNGNVISLGLQVQVIGPGGLAMQGKPVVDLGTVTQPLVSPLVNGTYVVNWRVVHDDGHPDAGTFSFALAAVEGPTQTGPPVSVRPIDTSTDETPPGLPPILVILGVIVVVLFVLLAVIIDRRRRSGS